MDKDPFFSPHAFFLPQPSYSRAPAPKFRSSSPPPTFPIMSRSGSQGKWVASSVTEKDIKELRVARYLTAEIAHSLPAKEQVIAAPEPGERLVFIPHFLRGL